MRALLAVVALLLASPPLISAEDAIFAPEAKLKTEAEGGSGGEGPAWHPELGLLTTVALSERTPTSGHHFQQPAGQAAEFPLLASPLASGLIFRLQTDPL